MHAGFESSINAIGSIAHCKMHAELQHAFTVSINIAFIACVKQHINCSSIGSLSGCSVYLLQEFFQENMGLMLTMTPNYEDYSCQFSFGQAPLPQAEDDVFSIPCFQDCPSKKQHRRQEQCHGIEATQQDA